MSHPCPPTRFSCPCGNLVAEQRTSRSRWPILSISNSSPLVVRRAPCCNLQEMVTDLEPSLQFGTETRTSRYGQSMANYTHHYLDFNHQIHESLQRFKQRRGYVHCKCYTGGVCTIVSRIPITSHHGHANAYNVQTTHVGRL